MSRKAAVSLPYKNLRSIPDRDTDAGVTSAQRSAKNLQVQGESCPPNVVARSTPLIPAYRREVRSFHSKVGNRTAGWAERRSELDRRGTSRSSTTSTAGFALAAGSSEEEAYRKFSGRLHAACWWRHPPGAGLRLVAAPPLISVQWRRKDSEGALSRYRSNGLAGRSSAPHSRHQVTQTRPSYFCTQISAGIAEGRF